MSEFSLTVDFADRADVRAKLPEAKAALTRMEADLRDRQEYVDGWREFVNLLERRAGLLPPAIVLPEPEPEPLARAEGRGDVVARSSSPPQPLDLVVEVVNRETRKIRAREVTEILAMEGHGLAKSTVSNALYYAAERADPPRVKAAQGRGFYAPLGFEESQDVYSANGASGQHTDLTREAVQRSPDDGTGGNPREAPRRSLPGPVNEHVEG